MVLPFSLSCCILWQEVQCVSEGFNLSTFTIPHCNTTSYEDKYNFGRHYWKEKNIITWVLHLSPFYVCACICVCAYICVHVCSLGMRASVCMCSLSAPVFPSVYLLRGVHGGCLCHGSTPGVPSGSLSALRLLHQVQPAVHQLPLAAHGERPDTFLLADTHTPRSMVDLASWGEPRPLNLEVECLLVSKSRVSKWFNRFNSIGIFMFHLFVH